MARTKQIEMDSVSNSKFAHKAMQTISLSSRNFTCSSPYYHSIRTVYIVGIFCNDVIRNPQFLLCVQVHHTRSISIIIMWSTYQSTLCMWKICFLTPKNKKALLCM